MYTIHVNDSPLRLVGADRDLPNGTFALRYTGKPKFFLTATGTLEGGGHPEGMWVRCGDVEAAWRDLRKHFRWVPAAGGAVLNKGRLLCIYRRGSWDLPKGKIDAGESPAEAALREVAEETGLDDVGLGRSLPTTYHTYYTRKGNRVLKPTHWFAMTTQQERLVAQTEEDIEEARWVPPAELGHVRAGMYPSLHAVVDAVLASPPRPRA